jgi:peptidoglycan hydrolase-like protein with peptidoglycan-binding domain
MALSVSWKMARFENWNISEATTMTLLKKGDISNEVRALQQALNNKGYTTNGIDGKFGQGTYDAVYAFQKRSGLAADGIAGKDTLKLLGLTNEAPARPQGGTVWESIVFPSSNRNRAAAMPTLEAVGKLTGTSPKLLATFVSIESAFDWTVKASSSTATGWFQHLDATWDALVKAYGSRYGLKADPTRAARKDPRANALMGAELLNENNRALKNVLGRDATDMELYAAHFFGAGTAKKFLTADRSAIAAELFPRQAASNVGIFYSSYNAKLPPETWGARTIGQVIDLFEKKVKAHRG